MQPAPSHVSEAYAFSIESAYTWSNLCPIVTLIEQVTRGCWPLPTGQQANSFSHLQDVRRLNDYFCEKEEEVVIMLQQLDEQTCAAQSDHEKQLCHVGYIHLHGMHYGHMKLGCPSEFSVIFPMAFVQKLNDDCKFACRPACAAVPLEHAELYRLDQDSEETRCVHTIIVSVQLCYA